MSIPKFICIIGFIIIGLQNTTAATFTKPGTSSTKSATTTASTQENPDLMHNHVHNFYLNDYDSTKPNYLKMQSHAVAMSYEAATHYLATTLPGEMDSLKRILLGNAYYNPLRLDLTLRQVKYTASYLDASNLSTVNPKRIVWKSYPIESSDIDIVKGYGCALSSQYSTLTTAMTQDDANAAFRIDKDFGVIIANMQSKYVVENLIKKTITSLQTGRYDYLFLDDVPRDPGNCVNKDYGGKGSYASWKEGQLAFLRQVTDAAHTMTGRQGGTIKVLGNIWSPYADVYSAKWYADKSLRLDHYYFESGGYASADAQYGQKANGTDPETGLPAFIPVTGGYLPANLMSLGTYIPTMYSIVDVSTQTDVMNTYLMQHYKAAGTAALQGSWFGWYGETSVDKVDSKGKLIHTNAMQLLRAIPNWENIAKIPLWGRHYDSTTNVYYSTRSKFSNTAVQGWNPVNNEIYAVFRATNGQVYLFGKKLVAASFVDPYFNKTTEDAMSCLTVSYGNLILKCSNKIDQGIRITVL